MPRGRAPPRRHRARPEAISPHPPATRRRPVLVLAPTIGAAHDDAALRVRAIQEAEPLAPVYVLVPTAAAGGAIQARLGSTMNVHVLEFGRLADAVLEAAGTPVVRLGRLAARRLVGRALAELKRDALLTTFRATADQPGLAEVLGEWLQEMKAQDIGPEEVRASAETSGRERDAELAAFYERTERLLAERGAADEGGRLRLAAAALEADPALLAEARGLVVVGFDYFSPVELRILARLGARLDAVAISLPWREDDDGESLVLARPAATRRALAQALGPEVEALPPPAGRPAALEHVRRRLFEADVEPLADEAGAVRAIAAPSREGEVRAALRAVKQRMLEGVPPDRIRLGAPDPSRYERTVLAVAEEYGVPVAAGRSLAASPPITALRGLLRLAPEFPWRETMDALRSPYFQRPWLDASQVDLLDLLSRERPVVAGREQWRHALQPLTLAGVGAEAPDNDLGPTPLVARLAPEDLAAIEAGLFAFFEAVTPPPRATHREHALWLQTAVLGVDRAGAPGADSGPAPEGAPDTVSLEMLARAAGSPATAERDRRAMTLLVDALRGLVAAAELVGGGAAERAPWSEFRADLWAALPARLVTDAGRAPVAFGPLAGGPSVPVDHLFVLGLSEGELPRRQAADVLYAPAEREAHPLPLRRVDPGAEASSWWQLLAGCGRTLTLLRPRIDDNGAAWPASPYWDAVLACVEGLAGRVERPRLAALATVPEAAGPAELLAALAAGRAAAVPPELAGAWRAAREAWRIAVARRSDAPPGPHEGTLGAPDIRADLEARFGEGRPWSASRLGRYGSCPYGFFAGVVLRLAPRTDPRAGITPIQRGQLLHALLEAVFIRLCDEDVPLTAAALERAQACVDAACDALFPTAPQRYGFRPGPLWRHEQAEERRLVGELVRAECLANIEEAAFRPWAFELRFGVAGTDLPAVRLETEDGAAFELHGVIDRVDRDAAGRLRLVDYKSGAGELPRAKVERGLALQTALYARAAEALLPGTSVAQSDYLHIPNGRRSGRVAPAAGAARDPTVAGAIAVAAGFVARIRAGEFPPVPGLPEEGGRCARSCDFAGLCGAGPAATAKARRMVR